MAAPSPNTNRRETVEFPPNIPVALSLKYSEPRIVSGLHGERAMFTTTDNRVLFVDPEVAGQITQLGINVRENFTLTRKVAGRKGVPDEWIVERTIGEQPNGTMVVPKLPEMAPGNGGGFTDKSPSISPNMAPPPAKPPQRAHAAAGGTALVDEANALVDAYAAVLDRALTTYNGRVKPDEVRSILLSAYIQRKSLAA